MIQGQSRFSRSLYNEAKNGAYYTDVGHARRIGKLFSFPSEVCVLEPCIGDARAVQAVLEKAGENGKDVHLFGIEINGQTCKALRERGEVRYLLHADFLTEVNITPKAFSFCFANPPYIATGEEKGERMEQRFVEKIFNYMKHEGYLALIVSYSTLADERFSRCLLSRFSCEGVWRFDDGEYAKYRQVVFIGKRRRQIGIFASEYKRILKSFELEFFPYLPGEDEMPSFRFEIPVSKTKDIEMFMETRFNPEECYCLLGGSSLYNMLSSKIFTDSYAAVEFGRPPLPMKKDLMYLAATAGGGQGIVGSEENHDIHLQRGMAKVVEESEVIEGEEGSNGNVRRYERVTSKTQITINIIENNGAITILQ